MSIADLPTGKWTELLIGDQWPGSETLNILLRNGAAREEAASQFERYADYLHNVSEENLAVQEGLTAEDVRRTFLLGELTAREIANSNSVKSNSYRSVHRHITGFRDELRALAEEGNEAIYKVDQSKATFPDKIAEIVGIIRNIKIRSAAKAASTAGEIYSEIQAVLAIQDIDTSARAFAADNSLGEPAVTQPDTQYLTEHVTRELQQFAGIKSAADAIPSETKEGVSRTGTLSASGTLESDDSSQPNPLVPRPASGTLNSNATPHETSPTALQSASGITAMAPSAKSAGSAVGSIKPTAATQISPVSQVTSESASGITGNPSLNSFTSAGFPPEVVGAGYGASSLSQCSTTSANPPRIEAPTPPTASLTTNPTGHQRDLARLPEHLNAARNNGTLMSASADAIAAAATPVHTSSTAPLSAPPAEAIAAANPTFERAHAAPTPTLEIPQPAPTEFPQHVIAASAPPALPATPISPGPVAPPPSPPGSLLAYGADLRPPVTAGPQPSPMPPSAAPGSAPVNPSGGSSPAGQPAVVRQQPTNPTTPTATAVGLTERALTATAAGAAVGALAADAAAQDRLRHLLDAVARQQPQLRWAIADLDDGTTVLVTDLASGWIPPHVEIPAGIGLLRPAHRRGDLSRLVGPATRTVFYQPGQHLAAANGAGPIAMSLRSRDTAAVDDLAWDLSQATKWRDGLPRLAHTLARAVSARTGFLDSEVELLREHLATVGRTVIARYPHVDPAEVGNWQLLATINALISDEKTLANYHFAWFEEHARTGRAYR